MIEINKSVPKLVGGIGEINFGKQYRQGNRIYDANEIAMCLMSQPVGNTGGYSYLYLINEKERGIKMKEFKNNLTKYDFKMDTIKLFDSFAGIGALHQSLKELGVPVEVVGMSEIDVDAIISYASIHIENFKNIKFEFLAEDDMRQWLMERNIGYSFEKQKSSIPRLKKDKLYNVYKASVLLNNLGDISVLDYSDMIDFDMFNFSFPCTDISGAGKQKGLKNEDGTPTRSGLVKYGIEVIKAKKPKYIMIENVKALIQKKFIGDFYDIVNEIESYGYSCYYPTKQDKKGNKIPTCLNAKDYGIPQNRERIFVICVRKDIDNQNFEFPIGFDNGLRLKNFLEDEIDEKYYLSQEIQNRFKLSGNKDIEHNELNIVGSSAPDFRTIGQRDMTYGINGVMSTLTATDYKQPKQILDTNKLDNSGFTVCEQRCDEGIRFFKDNVCGSLRTIDSGGDKRIIEDSNKLKVIGSTLAEGVTSFEVMNRVYDNTGISPTIDTCSGGNRQPKIIENNQFVDKKGRIQEFDSKNNYIQWDTSGKQYNSQVDRAFYEDGNVGTIPAMNPQDKTQVIEGNIANNFRIRKLTPKECWRLMGFRDECFDKAKDMGISDSGLYKQAGNSIVVNCLYYIFKNLFKEYIIK